MKRVKTVSRRPGPGRGREAATGLAAGALLAAVPLAGCSGGSGMERIDREVARLLDDSAGATSAEVTPGDEALPEGDRAVSNDPWADRPADPWDEQPPTANPGADALDFEEVAATDAETVIARLEGYDIESADALVLDLEDALAWATRNSREHRFAEEELVLSALRLLIERHRWGPRFFADISATARADADDGVYDSSLAVVTDLGVTQRLPYGGEVSARILATAVEDLHERVTGENTQSASILLDASIPLLRGAGRTAREDRVQAERNLIYATREYERFRRAFLFDVARDFLDLIVLQRQIENARRGVESFQRLEEQQDALYQAGRATPFDAAEAQNETLEAVDNLNASLERYRLAVDRFKARIGIPVDRAVRIVDDELGLPVPEVTLEQAVRSALRYRLDLQNTRDQVDDARRRLERARNNLLADFDLTLGAELPTDPDLDRGGLQFDPDELEFVAGVTYGLPLDREIERLTLRQSQIDLERSIRGLERTRDDVTIGVRGAVRGIDAALFSLRIQERNVEIAERRQESIEADPARANIRQRTDAINQVLRARDARDSARRDLELAVLAYLRDAGRLRVARDGTIRPLDGMRIVVRSGDPTADPADAADPADPTVGVDRAELPEDAVPEEDEGG